MSLNSCSHIAWLRVVKNEATGEMFLEETGRLEQVISEMPNPCQQRPRVVHFIGKRLKHQALRNVFPLNNIERRYERDNINLRADTASLGSDSPLIFVDSNPFANYHHRQPALCHESTFHSVKWNSEPHNIIDILYSRLFFMFCDVVCLFADDFPSLEVLTLRLLSWVEISTSSDLPLSTRPRLMIIVSEDGPISHARLEEFAMTIYSALEGKSSNTFSKVKIFRLAGEYLSPIARFQRLRDEIRNESHESQSIKQMGRCLFSTVHLNGFFHHAVVHTVSTKHSQFSFLLASRKDNPVPTDYKSHIKTFLGLAISHKLSYESIASFIASSILMNAFPPRMHCECTGFLNNVDANNFPVFSTQLVFEKLYKAEIVKALQCFFYEICAHYLCLTIEQDLEILCKQIENIDRPSSLLHAQNATTISGLTLLKSNITCLSCLLRPPQRHASCGHSFCEVCIRTLGKAVPRRESRFAMKCIMCNNGNVLADIKPKTAGIRIISIDGGGSRGIVPLETMKMLQDLLLDTPLNEQIDFAAGTSSGKLSTPIKRYI
jgi:hypothetical protein